MCNRRPQEARRPWAWLIFDVGRKKMKKRRYLIVALVTVIVVCGWWIVRSDARFISRVSGVAIPLTAWPVDSYSLDWRVVAKYRLSKEDAEALAARYPFVPFSKFD